MVSFTINIIFVGFISAVQGNSLFYKNDDFEDMFCADKMIPHGIKRSLTECASLCSLNDVSTGYFFDDENYCSLTEEHMSDVDTCVFREGNYYTKLGRSRISIQVNLSM